MQYMLLMVIIITSKDKSNNVVLVIWLNQKDYYERGKEKDDQLSTCGSAA